MFASLFRLFSWAYAIKFLGCMKQCVNLRHGRWRFERAHQMNALFTKKKTKKNTHTVNITWDKIWQVELSDVEKFTMWEQMRDTEACADFQWILFSQSLILVFKILLQKQYVEVKPYASFSCLAFVIAVHQGDYSNTLAIFGLAIFSKSFADFSGSLLQFFVCSSLCSFIYKMC